MICYIIETPFLEWSGRRHELYASRSKLMTMAGSSPSVFQKISLEFQNVCECIYSDKEICMVIYIILNQTKFTPRKGVFDISVFPLGKDFDMKIG